MKYSSKEIKQIIMILDIFIKEYFNICIIAVFHIMENEDLLKRLYEYAKRLRNQ